VYNVNHLIIGLGGTGGRIIRSFRKMVYQSFRATDPRGVNLDYLYVDSDDRMMGLTDSAWKIFGQSVQLDPRNQLTIKSADLMKCLDDIHSYGNLKPWLGSKEQWKDILSGIADATIGGQKRRLGRFLFARGIDDFEAKLNLLVRGLRDRGGSNVAFHVVCGLAGGTGSGSVIDVIAQIRRVYAYDTAHTHPVIVYALLPERVPKPNWNTGNYWANGYAALMELNALGLNWQPIDLKSSLGEQVRKQRFYDGCYVFSNENGHVTPDVEEEMPDIVASFLYQKTVMVQDSAFHQSLGRIEACENGDSSPEYDDAARSGAPKRCRNFLTFGVKRVAYPEEEIQEYISYTFGQQAANQLQYNNWVDSIGYAESELPQAPLADARKREFLERWKLSDEHLLLSRGILSADAEDKSWKLLHNEWHDLIPAFRQASMEGVNQNWLLAARDLFEGRFQTGFRRLGVAQFYAARRAARDQHCMEIQACMERQLFDEWSAGDRSMHDVGKLLDAVLTDIDLRKKAFDKKASDLAAEIEEVNRQIAANEGQWATIGFLGHHLLNHKQRLLDAQCPLLATRYERQTLREAYNFANAVLVQLFQNLNEFKAQVVTIAGRVAQVAAQYKKEVNSRLLDGAQQSDDTSERRVSTDQVVRFYDRSVVIRLTDGMKVDAAIQGTNAAQVRTAILAQLGGANNFRKLGELLTLGTLRDVIDRTCTEFSKSTHDAIARSEQQKVLGVNIITKLRERYDGDEEGLRLFAQDLIGHARDYLLIDRNQQYPDDVPPVRETIIVLPATDNNPFSERLATVLRNFAPGNVSVARSQTRQNEIVIVSLLNLFPLRYSSLVAYLKDKYEERMRTGDVARVRHEIQTEGDGTQFPDLFRLTGTDVGRRALPFYLLAHALGIIQQSPNARGTQEWALLYKNERGFPADPLYFGRTISGAQDRLEDPTVLLTLQREVTAKLGSRELNTEDARKGIQSALVEVISRVQAERNNDLNDPIFRGFRDAAEVAFDLAEKGN
jgi:hypothetical protein